MRSSAVIPPDKPTREHQPAETRGYQVDIVNDDKNQNRENDEMSIGVKADHNTKIDKKHPVRPHLYVILEAELRKLSVSTL